jgi:hypothetical protein
MITSTSSDGRLLEDSMTVVIDCRFTCALSRSWAQAEKLDALRLRIQKLKKKEERRGCDQFTQVQALMFVTPPLRQKNPAESSKD